MSIQRAKGPKGTADDYFSKIVRARKGFCEACGGTDWLQAAHIIGRSYAATRCEFDNAFCLCASCHRRFTDHPDEWMAFIDSTIGRDKYVELKFKAEQGAKIDWQTVAKALRDEWRAMERAA